MRSLQLPDLAAEADPHPLSARRFPNLVEVRTIPGRKNIAFVEFADEQSSGVARDALHNTKFSGTTGAVMAQSEEGLKIKVTFAKKG